MLIFPHMNGSGSICNIFTSNFILDVERLQAARFTLTQSLQASNTIQYVTRSEAIRGLLVLYQRKMISASIKFQMLD